MTQQTLFTIIAQRCCVDAGRAGGCFPILLDFPQVLLFYIMYLICRWGFLEFNANNFGIQLKEWFSVAKWAPISRYKMGHYSTGGVLNEHSTTG